VGSPRWWRILRTTMGSVSCAMRRRGPPQCGQVRTSTANTRRRSSAHVERDERERAEELSAVGELGASGPQEGEVDAGARLGTMRSRQAEARASTLAGHDANAEQGHSVSIEARVPRRGE
jgi:hypothetical protein